MSDIIENLQNDKSFHLELGDIIQLFAPSNDSINEETFYISYIDNIKLKLINVATYQLEVLTINSSGFISDESIQQINLLSRADEQGYCRQNGLSTFSWIEIHLGGELPMIITGEITNLEEDMIEVTTYPEKEIIYIDFEYKGIPENIPINKILLRDPISSPPIDIDDNDRIDPDPIVPHKENENEEDPIVEYDENGELYVNIPKNIVPEINFKNKLQNLYLNANEIFGKNIMIDEIDELIELPEHEKRYGLEIQLNDLIDELLSTVPMNKRTSQMLTHVHNLVGKFKELRNTYSLFDNNGNVINKKQFGNLYKPLIPHILNLDTKLNWILPVVKQRFGFTINQKEEGGGEEEDEDESSSEYEKILNKGTHYYHGDTFFNNNSEGGDQDKYKKYLQDINHFFVEPFINNENENQSNFLLYNKEINTPLDVIISNYSSFASGSIINNEICREIKFIMRKYDVGFSSQHQEFNNGKQTVIHNKLTSNDKIFMKSLLFMPLPIIYYSMIHLPNGLNILQRSNMNHNPLYFHKIFNQDKTIIDSYGVNKSLKPNIISNEKIQEFYIDPTNEEDVTNNNLRFRNYLESVIPNNHTIINLLKDQFQKKYSMVDVIKSLESFLLYVDNINYGNYKTIRFFVNQEIKSYISRSIENSKKFYLLKNANYNIDSPSPFNAIDLFFKEKVEYYYNEYITFSPSPPPPSSSLKLTSSEQLVHMIHIDNQKLFFSLLSYMILPLITNDSLMNMIQPPVIGSMDDDKKLIFKNCSRRFLSKRYHSMRDLQKDNGKILLVYDKEFDDTPYHLIKLYSQQTTNIKSNEFKKLLKEALIKNHNCPKQSAERVATSLIEGKKWVLEGEYAILEIKPVLKNKLEIEEEEDDENENENEKRKITQYYKRQKDHWILDKDIEHEAFMDNNSLFCNSDFNCFKNQEVQTCDSIDYFKFNIAKNTHQNVIKEFDKRIEVNFETLNKQFIENIKYWFRIQKKNKILNDILLYKSNYIAYDYGKTAITTEVLQSPYKKHLDLISSQSDFPKKQNDIVRFYQLFCREPFIDKDESPYWAYCKESNIKLLPLSIYQLAKTFIENGDYKNKLDELCNQLGELSEDGDCIIDKHCKCVLRNIDFVQEDGYDENGFKIITNDFIQPDIENDILNLKDNKQPIKRVYENETTQIIFNILNTLCENMNISLEIVYEFVMSTINEVINNTKIILEETKYNIAIEKKKKTSTKEQTPYNVYKNKIIIIIVSSIFLIAVQTVIPSIQSGKTFPGCIRSFSGYPMEGVEDLSGIKYISCVLYQIKTNISPWNSIYKTKVENFENDIKEVIDNFLIDRPDIIELYKRKRDYLLVHSENIIPIEHNINKWTTFLPPIVDCKDVIKNLTKTTKEFDSQFIDLIKQGHSNQRDYINIYKSKILIHTHGIIQNINNIVKKKDLLLKSMSKIPFLENSCCNEGIDINPLNYFIREDKNIELLVKNCQKFSGILKEVNTLSFAPFLFNNKFTGFIRPHISNTTIFKTNIYEAFIQYCNFENNMFIPEELQILIKEKPPSYKHSLSILEKIFFLEKNGKQFRENDLHSLMAIIRRRNLIPIRILQPDLFNGTNVQALNDLLDHFEMTNSSLCEKPLRDLLKNVLNSYDPFELHDIKDFSNNDAFINANMQLNNYLEKSNAKMCEIIMIYLRKFGETIPSNELEHIETFIENLIVWRKNDSDSFIEITQFIRNSIYHITKVFPHSIINTNYFYKIPNHKWGLSTAHNTNILSFVKKQYEDLKKFKNDVENNVFKEYLQKVQGWCNDIFLLVKSIPVESLKPGFNKTTGDSSLFYSLFNKDTVLLLFKNLWLSTLYEFIQTSNNDDLIRLERITNIINYRRTINENENRIPSNFLYGIEETKETTENDLDDDNDFENDNDLKMRIIQGDNAQLNNNVSSLLYFFITNEIQNKKIIDLNYQDINHHVSKTKKHEKDKFIKIFDDMGKSERGVEKQLKKFKLNRWNVGKEIYQYDKKTYDADEILQRMLEEMNNFNNSTEPIEINIDNDDNNNNNNDEQNDFNLNRDFTNGSYYSEDEDEDESDDY